ncbi:MAG: hypothetical protein ACE5G6_07005 [Terriglobia bacterium]
MNPFVNWRAGDFQHQAGEFCEFARATYGLDLDYAQGTVSQLEEFIDSNFGPGSADQNAALIVGMGCYLGEVIIRHHGGTWHADEEYFRSPAVVIEGKLQTHTFPLSRVWQRFEYGPERSLTAYYSEVRRTLSRF